jgi:hypothetical protein
MHDAHVDVPFQFGGLTLPARVRRVLDPDQLEATLTFIELTQGHWFPLSFERAESHVNQHRRRALPSMMFANGRRTAARFDVK